MSVYLDTSVLVSALTHEAASERTRAWLARQIAGDLVISDWVVTEVSSAFPAIEFFQLTRMSATTPSAIVPIFHKVNRLLILSRFLSKLGNIKVIGTITVIPGDIWPISSR